MENSKHLPIKLFQKRMTDERKTEGGGVKKDPKWLLSEEELAIRSQEFSEVINEAIEIFRKRPEKFDFIPTVLNLSVDDNAIAKSHRSAIKKVFNINRKSNIIEFARANNLLVKIDNIDDAIEVKQNIEHFKKNKIALSAIEELSRFEPAILLDEQKFDQKENTYKISLLNYYDTAMNNAVKATFEKYCQSNEIQIKETFYSPDLIIYKARNINSGNIEELKSFAALESFSFMPKYIASLDGLEDTVEVEIKEPIDGVEYPIVGILDSGIAGIKHLTPWLSESNYSSYPEEYTDKGHGTFVSGILLYGDELENKTYSGLEGCKIFDATVFPKGSIDEDELIDNIREAIRRNSQIKIWNMSLGTNQTCESDVFSDFGMALDNIQEVHNILICKSAGNCKNFLKNKPVSRIARSADSVRALVVGSIAHKKSLNDMAEINHPSPFSRVGHGPAGIIKPELVSYGGNAGVNELGMPVISGVHSFGITGGVISAVGTSFSTPRISALIAALDYNINDSFNPTLLKALAIHSSKYLEGQSMPTKDKIKSLGFGIPSPVNDIIYNDPYEITLIQQDTLVKGEFFEILEFPYPENLVDEDGYFYGEIKITLVANPVLNEKQGPEYCQSNIDVFFGTYDKLKERDVSKPNILNEIGLDGNENLIKSSHYSQHYKKDYISTFARERMLLDYGYKYQPIKKWMVNLEEMTSSNKEKFLATPKKWYLKVSGLYRDFSESLAIIDGEELSQDFSLLITIRDNKRKHNVYDTVSNLLRQRNFNHSDIKLRQEVRARV